MVPKSEDETKQRNLQKYKELYDLSKEVFYEEVDRSARIDEKASKYLTLLTFLLGAFAFFGGKLLESVIPPHGLIEWSMIIMSGLLLLLIVIAWFFIFQIFNIHTFRKIPIDIKFFDDHNLINVYYALSKAIKENLKKNRIKGDDKSRNLYKGYALIRIIVVLLIIISILFVIHSWVKSEGNNKRERRIEMVDNSKEPEKLQDEIPEEPLQQEPDPNVIPPEFDIVTEGFDPSDIQEKSGTDQDQD